MRRMIANAEVLTDHPGHSGQRPEIGAKPRSQWSLAQPGQQLLLLGRRQARGAARDRLRAQPPEPCARVRLPPPMHRTHRGGELPRHRGQCVPGLDLRDRPASPLLQLLGCAGWSHASYAVTRPPTIFHSLCKTQ
jgi:hypothetical protein